MFVTDWVEQLAKYYTNVTNILHDIASKILHKSTRKST